MWKTDYMEIHEKQYQYKKENGRSGWNDEKDVPTFLNIIDNALRKRWIKKLSKLLELGCGDGSNTVALAAKGFDVYGIDISPTAITWAQEKAKKQGLKGNFQVGNVTELPFIDNFFDLVLDADCSHCIIGNDRKLFFSNAFRVLKSDGLFIMMARCGEPKSYVKRFDGTSGFDPVTRCLVKDGIAERYIGLSESILEEISSAGFRTLHWEIVTYEELNLPDEIIVYSIKP